MKLIVNQRTLGPYSEIVQPLMRQLNSWLHYNYIQQYNNMTGNLVYSSLYEVAARLEEGTAVVGGISAQVRSPVLAVTSDDVSQLFCSFLSSHIR